MKVMLWYVLFTVPSLSVYGVKGGFAVPGASGSFPPVVKAVLCAAPNRPPVCGALLPAPKPVPLDEPPKRPVPVFMLSLLPPPKRPPPVEPVLEPKPPVEVLFCVPPKPPKPLPLPAVVVPEKRLLPLLVVPPKAGLLKLEPEPKPGARPRISGMIGG